MTDAMKSGALQALASAFLCLAAGAAQAQAYKCTSAAGKTYYQDQPCPGVKVQKDLAPKRADKEVAAGRGPRPLPPPPKKGTVKPWAPDDVASYISSCIGSSGQQKMSDFARKHGARLPAETQEKWTREMAVPCHCLQGKAAARWSYETFMADRDGLEPRLKTASPDCFR